MVRQIIYGALFFGILIFSKYVIVALALLVVFFLILVFWKDKNNNR